jgi:hypothetical protein
VQNSENRSQKENPVEDYDKSSNVEVAFCYVAASTHERISDDVTYIPGGNENFRIVGGPEQLLAMRHRRSM